MNHDLDNAQINADGNPECGDQYCPGPADCPDCRALRDADRQRYESNGNAANGDGQ